MQRNCKRCLFDDVCDGKRGCQYFSPIDPEESEVWIDNGTDQHEEYYDAWLEYVADHQGCDSLFDEWGIFKCYFGGDAL